MEMNRPCQNVRNTTNLTVINLKTGLNGFKRSLAAM